MHYNKSCFYQCHNGKDCFVEVGSLHTQTADRTPHTAHRIVNTLDINFVDNANLMRLSLLLSRVHVNHILYVHMIYFGCLI